MYWRSADVSAWGAHRRVIGRSIGGAGMNAPPTQWPVLVVKVHHCVPTDFFRLLTNKDMRYFGTAAILDPASSSFKIVER